MSWSAYKVVFRLKSPLHIGWRKVGNLQQTRPYVTGKVLWGALTARLTRMEAGKKGRPAYKATEDRVNKQLAFTYFFPALTPRPEGALYPWHTDNGLVYGDIQLDVASFDYLFLDSYPSTALDYDRNAAELGALHEVEFIRPRTRPLQGTEMESKVGKKTGHDGEYNELGAPVFLMGYILEKDGCDLDWKKALNQIQLGGERGYGWGRVKLESKPQSLTDDQLLFGKFKLTGGNEFPILNAESTAALPAHALAANFKDAKPIANIKGTVEPLVGRETRFQKEKSFGAHVSRARICYVPGSNVDAGARVRIGPYGIWEAER